METNVLPPTSINKKRSADFGVDWNELSDHEKKVLQNRKRGFRLSKNARINKGLHKTVNDFIQNTDLCDHEMQYFTQLRRCLSTCCSKSLYRQYDSNQAVEYIASETCKHKLCKVCNAEREKALRRKYLRYFEASQMIDKKTGEVNSRDDFDYMHLTLTVPHTEKGFFGKKWYATEIMQLYNKMRKCDWWKYHVWGGEFGCEVTKNENGLHIHIHSLLIVRKSKRNRNILHQLILTKWNELAADKNLPEKEFSEDEKTGVAKSLRGWAEWICEDTTENRETAIIALLKNKIAQLDRRGATMVGLENLFVYSAKKVSNYDSYDREKQKWKHYIDVTDETQFMRGVMECIKYHFEPMAFDKENGLFQFDLLREILPNIYRKPLYRKFGNLHGVKELNINENPADPTEEIKEAIEELGSDAVNPETGEPDTEFNYVVVSASAIFYDLKDKLKPTIPKLAKRKIIFRPRGGIAEAIAEMLDLAKWRKAHKHSFINENLN